MKKLIISLTLLLAAFNVLAQNNAPTPTIKSLVVDSSGMILPFMVWQSLIATNDYWPKPINPAKRDTPFQMVKYTEQENSTGMIVCPALPKVPFLPPGR